MVTEIQDAVPGRLAMTRLGIAHHALRLKCESRRFKRAAKLADGLGKFGGGSLLTATALLLLNGQWGPAVLGTAVLTLILFVAGTIFSLIFEGWSDRAELEEEHLNAVLREAGQ